MKIIILALSLAATNAFAYNGLGKQVSIPKASSALTQISQKSTIRTNYKVNTTIDSKGATINEYVDNSGKIFAITWNSPALPNLEELLGEYFTDYKNPKNIVSHPGHGSLEVSNGDLVVQNKGHLRAFFGIAYLKNSIPAGVDISQLQ